MNHRRKQGQASSEELPGVAWRISTRSPNAGGSCVEAGPLRDRSGRVALRHSHHPDSHTFIYTRDSWTAFLTSVKHGHADFDD